ncbi:MAG: LOG family protein [Chthoniobacter sp.]|nr:LOG family protein [Chthoniobacter sp.]
MPSNSGHNVETANMTDQNQIFGQTDIVKLSDEDASVALLEHAVTGLWEVVNDLARFRRTTRQNYRVTIFGSARIKPGTPAYEGVKKLAAELTSMGCDILTGGGPGLMQAANEGAYSVDPNGLRRSVGINIELPFEQQVNPFVSQAYGHRTFFSRLHHFMIASDASVVVPGGIGSLLELSIAWQLLQVRKLYNTPLILVGKMWANLVDWARNAMLIEGSELASDADFKIPHCVNTIEETIALIRENRAAWLASQPPK